MNEKSTILKELDRLNILFSKASTQSSMGINPSEKVLEQMESMLFAYLEKHPQDTEVWLKLTMVEFTPPFRDYERIEKYITTILKYDENNVQALLILADAQCAFRGNVAEDLFIRLQNACAITPDKKLLSMIYLAIAWYSWYSLRDEGKYEQALLQSIDYCNQYVYNYELLGRLYLKVGRKAEGKKMINYALTNVQKIYGQDYDSFDVTDINEFFSEFFTGNHITPERLKSICELVDE